jgi:hypothetical protein
MEKSTRQPHGRPKLAVRIGDKRLTGDATTVFLRTIEAIGVERVANSAASWKGHLLAARTRPQCLHSSGEGWHVAIPHSAVEKHRVLVDLKKQLSLPMTIALIDP